MHRRTFLIGGTAIAALAVSGLIWRGRSGLAVADEVFEVTRTDSEWKALLGEERYQVLRREATEPAGSSPLNFEKRKGTFHCGGCDLPAYSSQAKYDSGTGWPSFWESLPDAIGTREDRSFFMVRTECHCRRCGGHFGHIFDDGPKPTGMRHCLNGLALTFMPDNAA